MRICSLPKLLSLHGVFSIHGGHHGMTAALPIRTVSVMEPRRNSGFLGTWYFSKYMVYALQLGPFTFAFTIHPHKQIMERKREREHRLSPDHSTDKEIPREKMHTIR